MKKYALLATILFSMISFGALAQEEVVDKEKYLEEKIEQILDNSNLSLKEKTEVQILAFERLSSEKTKSENFITDDVDQYISAATDKAKKYTAFTSALGVKFVELASQAGVEADKFVDESWIGKFALFGVFYMHGGEYLFDIIWYIIFAFTSVFLTKTIIEYFCFGTLKVASEEYEFINSKRNVLGRLLFKSPTYKKKVLIKKIWKEPFNNELPSTVGYYFSSLIVSSVVFMLLAIIVTN